MLLQTHYPKASTRHKEVTVQTNKIDAGSLQTMIDDDDDNVGLEDDHDDDSFYFRKPLRQDNLPVPCLTSVLPQSNLLHKEQTIPP